MTQAIFLKKIDFCKIALNLISLSKFFKKLMIHYFLNKNSLILLLAISFGSMHADTSASDEGLKILVERIEDSDNVNLQGTFRNHFIIKATAEGFSTEAPLRVGVLRSLKGKIWHCFGPDVDVKDSNAPILIAKEPLESAYPLFVFKEPEDQNTIYIDADPISVGEILAVIFAQGDKYVLSEFIPGPLWSSNKDQTLTLKAVLAAGNPTIYDLTIVTTDPDEEYQVKGWSLDQKDEVQTLKGKQTLTLEFSEAQGIHPIEIELKNGEKVFQNLPYDDFVTVADRRRYEESNGARIERTEIALSEPMQKLHGVKSVYRLTPRGFKPEETMLIDVYTSVTKTWQTIVHSKQLLGDWFKCHSFFKLVPYFLVPRRMISLLVEASPSGPSIDHVDVGCGGCFPGEVVRLKFFTPDRKMVVEESITPFPIFAESADGRVSLWAALESESPTEYLLYLYGVGPNESVKVTGLENGNPQTIVGPQTIPFKLPLQQRKIKRKLPPMLKEASEDSGIHSVVVELNDGQKLTVDLPYGKDLQPKRLLNDIEVSIFSGGLNFIEPSSQPKY